MSLVTHRTLDSATLRDWLPTATPPERARATTHDERDLVTSIFEVLLSSQFRKGSLGSMGAGAFVARNSDRVAARVRRNEPIQLTIVSFPFKVPNPLKVGRRALPDLAEVVALKMLERLNLAVQDAYAPGVEVVILHDGSYIADAFGVPLHETYAYADYFRWLLQLTGTETFVRCKELLELLRTHWSDGAERATGLAETAQTAARRAGENEATAFRKTLGMLNVRWLPRELLPCLYEEIQEGDPASFTTEAAALYSQVRQSMERYAVCDALLHRFDPRGRAFPEAIHATTKPQPGRLALWIVRRGRSLLPWHGVGVVNEAGRIEVRYAAEVEASGKHRPVFLEGETTPFFYEYVGS
jgi:hypothetical protein